MSQFLQWDENLAFVVKVWLDSPSHGDLPDHTWRPEHGECLMVARGMSVSALVWALVRCWFFHSCLCATRDVFGAVCGGGGLSGPTALAQMFLHFQGAQQSCRQIFWGGRLDSLERNEVQGWMSACLRFLSCKRRRVSPSHGQFKKNKAVSYYRNSLNR